MLVAMFVLGVSAYINMRSREVTVIQLIISDDYRGIIKLRFSSSAGKVMNRRAGKVTFHIPRDGTLDVEGKNVQFDAHRVEASYSDGRNITGRDSELDANLKADPFVHIWDLANPLPPAGNSEAWFFVGTDAEYKMFSDQVVERYSPSQKGSNVTGPNTE